MNPLPEQFTNRWAERPGAQPFQDAVCWHVLLGGQPAVRSIVGNAQRRLTGFAGLHMTPLRWLHITVLLAGPATEITQHARKEMLTRASSRLSRTPPVTVTLRRVLYHPEAIALEVSPATALSPILEAAQAATREVTGTSGVADGPGAASSWTPHLTLCYSTAKQSAAPVIAALGNALPACEVTIDQLNLVVQNGPEPLWDWHPVGAARLLGARHGTGSQPLGHRSAERPAPLGRRPGNGISEVPVEMIGETEPVWAWTRGEQAALDPVHGPVISPRTGLADAGARGAGCGIPPGQAGCGSAHWTLFRGDG